MIEHTKYSIENPEKFLSENKEFIEQYLAFKQSHEYKSSPICKIHSLLKEFNSRSGYCDIFIPAMKKLSNSYANYYKQIEIANEKLLKQYPQIAKFDKVTKNVCIQPKSFDNRVIFNKHDLHLSK